MKTKTTVLLLALVAGTFAAGNMKQRLAQMNANNLAEMSGEGSNLGAGSITGSGCDISFADIPAVNMPECTCQFSQLPGLGAGLN